MHFTNVADLASPDHFAELTGSFVGVALVAHLSGHTVLASGLAQFARFKNKMSQRLLHVHVNPTFHSPGGGHGVCVIGRRDGHCVDASFLVQHLAEIFILFCLGIFLERLSGIFPVGIAQGHDVFTTAAFDVRSSFPSSPNGGDVELLVGRFIPQLVQG